MASNPKEFLNFKKQLGKKIQKARKQNGITQEKLAELTGLDRVSIGYIEQGKRAPKLQTLYRIAKKIGCKNP